jgi:hypothetical protein
MTNQNLSTTISVDRTPQEAFGAINNVRGWWSKEIEGSTNKLGDEFTYHYKDGRAYSFPFAGNKIVEGGGGLIGLNHPLWCGYAHTSVISPIPSLTLSNPWTNANSAWLDKTSLADWLASLKCPTDSTESRCRRATTCRR